MKEKKSDRQSILEGLLLLTMISFMLGTFLDNKELGFYLLIISAILFLSSIITAFLPKRFFQDGE